MKSEAIAPYAPVLIKLLQSVVYYDDPQWNLLLQNITSIQEYFARMGVEVYLKEADGYAYLRQPEPEEDEEKRVPLPRLTRRDRLSYYVTLLCVLLRERLYIFESSSPDADRLILREEEIYDMVRPFYRDRGDERTLRRKMTTHIKQCADLGFLKIINTTEEPRYEVRPILRSRLDSEKLAEIKEKLVGNIPDES